MKVFSNCVSTALAILAISSTSLWAQIDVRDGLVMQYLLEETGGNTAHDSSGSNFNLEYSGGTPSWTQPGVFLDRSSDQTFVTPSWEPTWPFDPFNPPPAPPTAPYLGENFSFTAWIKGGPYDGQTVVTGGIISLYDLEFGVYDRRIELVINEEGADSNSGGVGQGGFATSQQLSNTDWQHVAVTNDGQHTRFYLNGQQIHELSHFIKPNNLTDSKPTLGLRLQRFVGGENRHPFNGTMRDVRVYNRAISPAELSVVLTGPREVEDTLAGLWVGEVTLNEVKEAKTGEWGAAGSPFGQRILMWSDGISRMELLQEAMVVQTQNGSPVEVVLTDETQVSNYDGIVPRGDKLVGIRFSSSSMLFDGESVPLIETGSGDEVRATLTLADSHPRNPFRHKYHPDLGTGLTIGRTITINWEDGDLPADGVIGGLITETITGLHKDPLEARGTVTFTRASLSQLLNP